MLFRSTYVSIITDYSWGILGPIEISKLDKNLTIINQYISKVINTKIFLSIIALFILLIALYFYHFFSKGIFCILSIFLLFFSRSQNVHWIFIGINKINIYFYIYALCKVCSVIFILFFLNKSSNITSVFFVLGFFDTILFIFSYLYLYIKYKFKYNTTSLKDIIQECKIGYKLFLTFLSICSLSNSSILILGIMVKPEIVGIYSVAEKIVMLIKNCTGVLFIALFPKVCEIGTSNMRKLNKFLFFLFKSYFFLFLVSIIILIFLTNYIIPIFSKIAVDEIRTYLIYLSPIIIIAALGQQAYMSLVITEQKNKYSTVYFGALIFNLIMSFFLCFFLGVYGIIISLILTELFITSLLNYLTFNKFETNFFKNI